MLVTGGAGFIGSHLVDHFLRTGWSVRVVDSLETRVHPRGKPAYLPAEVEFIQADVRDRERMRRALRGVDVVSHQAAYQDYMPDYSRFMAVNAVSVALIMEIIHEDRLPVHKMIIASSQAVYGEGQYECARCGPFQPDARSEAELDIGLWEISCPACGDLATPLLLREEYANPFNAYALSKLSEEMISLRLGRLLGIPSVALRYSITQGPRQSPFNAYSGICRIFTARIMNGQPPIVFEDGRQTRDFVHVQDVVDANMLVLDHHEAVYQVYNVGSGQPTTVLDYARALAGAMGSNAEPLLSGEYRIGDNRHSVSDISKLTALGWRPKRSLQDIFIDYLDWLQNESSRSLLADGLRRADQEMRSRGVIRRVQSGRKPE